MLELEERASRGLVSSFVTSSSAKKPAPPPVVHSREEIVASAAPLSEELFAAGEAECFAWRRMDALLHYGLAKRRQRSKQPAYELTEDGRRAALDMRRAAAAWPAGPPPAVVVIDSDEEEGEKGPSASGGPARPPAAGGRGAGGSAPRRAARTSPPPPKRKASFAAARLPWRVKRQRAGAIAEDLAKGGCDGEEGAGLYGEGPSVLHGPSAGIDVAVVLDSREGGGRDERLRAAAATLVDAGVPGGSVQSRALPCGLGDYALVAVGPGGGLLPYAVERKRADDLALSMVDGRLARQRAAMLRLRAKWGVQPVLLLEGDPARYVVARCGDGCGGVGACGRPTVPELEARVSSLAADGFRVLRAFSFEQSMRLVAGLRLEAVAALDAGRVAPLAWDPFGGPGPPGPTGPAPDPEGRVQA